MLRPTALFWGKQLTWTTCQDNETQWLEWSLIRHKIPGEWYRTQNQWSLSSPYYMVLLSVTSLFMSLKLLQWVRAMLSQNVYSKKNPQHRNRNVRLKQKNYFYSLKLNTVLFTIFQIPNSLKRAPDHIDKYTNCIWVRQKQFHRIKHAPKALTSFSLFCM